MTKYLVLYRSSMSAGEQMAGGSPEEAQAGMELWMNWAGRVGDANVDRDPRVPAYPRELSANQSAR